MIFVTSSVMKIVQNVYPAGYEGKEQKAFDSAQEGLPYKKLLSEKYRSKDQAVFYPVNRSDKFYVGQKPLEHGFFFYCLS